MAENQLFYPRLEESIRISKKSFNQVERDLGYPRNALHNYKNGVEPSGIRLIELAHYFGVTPEYLLGINNDPKNNGTRIIFESLNDYQKKDLCIICQEWLLSSK
ncbi:MULTISPECIES: helix-turn-helix transcriptional regulator [Lactococcus]|uniref:helix-turn-helix domain-containing protein n=1 Tax=Lactococcus TaxID=1357 RepID=UPI00142F5315|nr:MULTISPECIES: helix-turn-helix transcriptional regulator [Lactococcus]KAF6611151.1 helix-turn-helix transcriptional regulator [Lactococcus sp. EKM201L]KAF6613964.1 helix-turn-helix transcriptional regulator [Lactococcus sp. EKM203L]KAF6642289.1 helix-turn-helix transcriptional regulator [Lactococcus sp. EKM501L]KAF6645068.1 helix-turn-helix transcriptional regulator [Lactococcus sp. EKM502L]KAF6654164.1 helix-turn-helix transcriptional regulator [Lactococcus sp. EKM101L]